VLSTGEACTVALLLDRLDLLKSDDQRPLAALERPEWPRTDRSRICQELALLLSGTDINNLKGRCELDHCLEP
jgi:hypothetical protein